MKNTKLKQITLSVFAVAIAFSLGSQYTNIKAQNTLQSTGKLIYNNNGEEVVIDTNDHQLLKDDINNLESSLGEIGTIYTGAWTLLDGGIPGTVCTEPITLPKGIYIVTYSIPPTTAEALVNLSVNGYELSGDYVHCGGAHTSKTVIFESLGNGEILRVVDAGGAIRKYSNLDYGGIKAVRIK